MEHVKPSISASTPAQLLMKKEEHRILPNAVQNAGSHLVRPVYLPRVEHELRGTKRGSQDSIPDTRRIILQALPKVPFSLPDEGLGMAFKRPYIAQHVGGGSVVRCISQTVNTARLIMIWSQNNRPPLASQWRFRLVQHARLTGSADMLIQDYVWFSPTRQSVATKEPHVRC